MRKPLPSRISKLEAAAASRARYRKQRATDYGPAPSSIIREKLLAIEPFPPIARENFDADTQAMREQVIAARGGKRAIFERLLRLRIAHAK